MTLNELANERIETYQKDHIRRQTYVKYKCILKNYIKNDIGEKELKTITKRDLQIYINDLKTKQRTNSDKIISASTVNTTLTVLKLIFNYACDFDILQNNPTHRVRGAREEKERVIKCFTIDEQIKIEKYC